MENTMQKNNEFNFISKQASENDIEILMGPFEETDGPIIKFPDNWIMAHIMHSAGIFKSVTEARKNGWNKPIPPGFIHLTVTKKKIDIWILNKV